MGSQKLIVALLMALIVRTSGNSAEYPPDKVIQRMQKRLDPELVGKTISGIVVSKITHIARLDSKNQNNEELSCKLIFNHAELINESQNVVEFQFRNPVDGDAVHLRIDPCPATSGRIFVVTFSVYGLGEFTHRHARTIGDAQLRPIGRTSGTTGGHIGMHGVNPPNKSVTYSLLPETDDPWLFASCDIYVLE